MANHAVLEEIEEKFGALHAGSLIKDGIVDKDAFNKAERKILWVLEEGNDKEQTPWSLCSVIMELIENYKYSRTLCPLCRYSWAILNGIEDFTKVPPAKNIMVTLKQVAVINVKKIGGKSNADRVPIKRLYNEHKALIKEQIEAIDSDIIINCSGMKDIFTDFKTGAVLNVGPFRKAPYKKGIIIEAYHPAQRTLPHATYFKNIWECLK
jgi:hypothetical protein